MKILAFERDGQAALGVVDGDEVVDLASATPDLPHDLKALIEQEDGLDAARSAAAEAGPEHRHPLAGLTLLPPIERPGKILCLGLNYADHAAEGGFDKPDYPTVFMRGPTSLTAHGQPIVRPLCSEQLDYEAELAVVVGRHARHLTEENALDCIAGYACFNDASVRDYQRRSIQWTMGKNFDHTGAFGPWMITPDELPSGAVGLHIETRLNGRVLQSANTRDMIFPVIETLVLMTECLTLEPGDLIVTGTPAGVGHARKPPLWMKAGDVVEVEVEGVGVLRNPIVDETPH